MCGRYTLFADREIQDLEDILARIDNETGKEKPKTGEIFPSDAAPVLIRGKAEAEPRLLTWGFPGFKNKQLIINARAETVIEKPMFHRAFESRRCIIPSTGFYEWDREKNKYLFNLPDSAMLYMAGLYSIFDQEERFVILTKDANKTVAQVHSRMPVVLGKRDLNNWIYDREAAVRILTGSGPDLVSRIG